MKTRILAGILVVVVVIGGCTGETVQETEFVGEVRPGVYSSSDPADFPFPTSGYTIYMVGEAHGNRETKRVFQAYLQSLYKETGLRDVILEEDQAYEADANAYIHGLTDVLHEKLCLRADILGMIRDFNTELPMDEKVVVHLVDVDSPMPTIYKHVTELHQQLGPAAESIQLPEFSDFNTWVPRQRKEFVEALQDIPTSQPGILNGLDTVSLSLEWYLLGNRMDVGWPQGLRRRFAPLREDVITKNIQFVLSQLNGKPVLAFFGASHGMKIIGAPNPPVKDFKSWTERLIESGVDVYSLSINGLSGRGSWRGDSFEYEVKGNQQYEGTDEYRFEDGTSLASLFETYPDSEILYADMLTEENASIRLPSWYFDMPASQIYDGLVIFKEFTPMEDVCAE